MSSPFPFEQHLRRPPSKLVDDLVRASPGERLIRTSRIRLFPGSPPAPVPQDEHGEPRNLTGRFCVYLENRAVEGWDPPLPAIFVGGPDVSPRTGYPIRPKETVVLDMSDSYPIHAIQDGTSPQAELWVIEVG